ncbi:MAG: magnesium transporter [Planctomycetaceae bacterium]|nr:magnesium transporter [Planctomycetaceae bacterium]
MRNPLLAPDLREFVAERDEAGLRDFFSGHHPADAAELLEDLEAADVQFVLGLLPGRERAAIFDYLDKPLQDAVAELMDDHDLAALITYMSHDERAGLMSRLPVERPDHIFQLLARAEREDIRRLQSYEENSTGAVMTSDYALVPADETAAAAIERLRHVAPDRETIYYCYVVDEDRHLKGFVSLKNLIIAPAHRRVADIMQRDCVYANVNDDREATAEKLREYDLLALPVVDNEHRLVGIVTHDDVIDVIVDEATEDVHRMGGVGPLEETYLESSFRQLWLNRALWLSILFVAGFLTALALEKFQGAFEEVPALVFFIPLIISAGGNCGSQSATLIMRALALGELTPRDWFRVFNREVLMGFSLGLGLGAVGFLRALITPSKDLPPGPIWKLPLTIGLAVCAVVLCGNLVGALMPLGLKRLGFDPALMSNPFVASLVDVTGIVLYFAIAQAILL